MRQSRPSGNTYKVLEECANIIEEEGLEVEIIPFVGKKIQSCIACGRCGEIGECSLKDDLNPIISKIKESEGLIVGSPVYFGTARAISCLPCKELESLLCKW
jgi:multimeric flavodoxin WrbA